MGKDKDSKRSLDEQAEHNLKKGQKE